ncbi:hypothetical protein AAG570_010243 [Ranatra chinensis]|uniref:Serpin domain-containing protein n=1 Tax=Ranatra chinensis TaxID=642074 RepID=A0ABD0YLZ8_9HEMI
MFCQNKKQETMEIGACNLPSTSQANLNGFRLVATIIEVKRWQAGVSILHLLATIVMSVVKSTPLLTEASSRNWFHEVEPDILLYTHIIAIVPALFLLACSHLAASDHEFTSGDLVKANNKLAFQLYNALKENNNNLFISPWSINSALGLLFMMSKGPTSDQLARVMNFNSSDYQAVTSAFKNTLQALEKNTMSWANGVFIDNDMVIKQAYKDDVKEYMDASTENVDFGKGIEESRQYINRWVAQHTHDMIKELLPPAFSHSGPKAMVLLSAVHFQGDWIERFNKTSKAPFHAIDGTVQEVDMMSSERKHFGFGWISQLSAKALRIDYKGKSQSMVLLLPERSTTLEKMEAQLAELDVVKDVFDRIRPGDEFHHDIRVSIPKFTIEDKHQLKETMIKLGLTRVFESMEADFTRASDLRNLEVSEIFHKAAIKIDETGTEASAATDQQVSCLPFFPNTIRPLGAILRVESQCAHAEDGFRTPKHTTKQKTTEIDSIVTTMAITLGMLGLRIEKIHSEEMRLPNFQGKLSNSSQSVGNLDLGRGFQDKFVRSAGVGKTRVALVGVSLGQPTGSPEEEFSAKHVARGINKFAFDLYMEVKGEGNVFISPLSVSSALGMVYMMSNGETANELTRLMHFNNSNYDKVTSGFHSMLQSLDKNSLKAANGLFIGKDLPVKQSFKDEVKKQFNATSENIDFGGEAEKSRKHINEWVADKTEQNIKELLPKDFSSAVGEHAMVLCSAVHFKNDWIAPFNETRKGKFHSIDGTVEEVDMMFSSDTHFGYYYFRDLEVTALRIDYKDKMQSMLLLMPVGNRKFEEVEAQLVEMDIVEDILNKMYDADKTPIDVTMPKFKLESSYQLKAPLQKVIVLYSQTHTLFTYYEAGRRF